MADWSTWLQDAGNQVLGGYLANRTTASATTSTAPSVGYVKDGALQPQPATIMGMPQGVVIGGGIALAVVLAVLLARK